jgi:hypothetical protein
MSTGSASQWVYPTTPWQNTDYTTSANTGYIAEAASSECLQIDEADYRVVRLAQCVGDEAEMWENWYNPMTKRTELVSEYYYDGLNSLCLSFDASGTDVPTAAGTDFLRADPCVPGGAPLGGTSH